MTLTATLPRSFPATTGQEVNLYPVSSELTVAQAAKRLRMSENHLSDLLDTGQIASRQENGKSLIPQTSLLEYEQWLERRHVAADELFNMFQEAGMSDDYND